MLEKHRKMIERNIGSAVVSAEPMTGGFVADTQRVVLHNGKIIVIKVASKAMIATEAMMLEKLQAGIATPEVLFSQDNLLIMEFIPNDHQPRILHSEAGLVLMDDVQRSRGAMDMLAEIDAGKKIASLHNQIRGKKFGLDVATFHAGMVLDNTVSDNWLEFFAMQRLLPMAKKAMDAGCLNHKVMSAVESIVSNIGNFITPPKFPSLLHGDLWRGNMLFHEKSLMAVIDPAIYYGHHQVDLASLMLMNPVGKDFFESYSNVMPIDKNFFTTPILVYQLYFYLLYCRLLGTQYLSNVERCIRQIVSLT